MKEHKSKISLAVYFVFLSVSIVWVSMILLAPYLYSGGGSDAGFGSYIYLFFSATCHQIDSRSFTLFGFKLAVCSRCTIIYGSFLFSVILYPLVRNLNEVKIPGIWVLLIPAVMVALDAILDFTGIFPNTFLSRAITGFLLGFVLPLFLIPGFINLFRGLFKIFD